MQQRIFYSIFLLCAFLLILANVFLLFYMESFFKKQLENDLKKQANSFLSLKNFHSHKEKDFSRQNRISIIDENGNVIFDNFASNLENHLDRQEIKETLKNGESLKMRYSHTLKMDLLYYAKAFKDANSTQIIRIAMPQKHISDFSFHIILLFAIEFLILLLFCFVLAKFLTRWILNPIKNINLERIDKKGVYTELHGFIEKIKAQNNAIKKSYKKLIQKQQEGIKLRKEFSANVTHELKTPLTSILASSQMLKNHLVKLDDIPHFIDKIYVESKRLLEMIDEILQLSFFDENRQNSLPKSQVNLKKIVLKVISVLNPVAKMHGVELKSDLEDIEILGVYELLENLIYNLCDNGIKYNKQNGFVSISLKKEQNQIKLTVKDSGIGIKKEYQARIFERFFCVDKSRSKRLGGTGLGLSIVKHACLYHKAKIILESQVGMGSEFCIIFKE